MLLLLLNQVVLMALWKIDAYLISTLVNKSLHYYYYQLHIQIFCVIIIFFSSFFPFLSEREEEDHLFYLQLKYISFWNYCEKS